MQLVQDLPEIFESFAEQRKKSFLMVKEWKDQGKPIVGSYCTYFPKEIAMAAGAASVSLCSTSDETIAEAEKDLPKNLCPLIKSSYGFAKTDKCPFFYFSDVVVGESTCDGKKKMYELMSEFKDVFFLRLPHEQTELAVQLYRNEIIRLKDYLSEKFQVDITDEMVREATRVNNRANQALKDFYGLMKHDPTPISGYDGATEKVIRAVEENGGVVVGYENCTGEKAIGIQVDENAEDIYEAISRRYLAIGCSVMTPNNNRFQTLGDMISEYHADGVLDMTLQACHTYAIETNKIRRFVNEEKGIPYLNVETDYSQSDVGQLNTRVAAFIEML